MRTRSRPRGFTMIELIVVVGIVGVILTLAAPSFHDYILRQRLKSVQAQLVTDLAFARSHAAANGREGRVRFQSDATQGTCYTVYTVRPVANHRKIECDCRLGAGAACPADAIEARTVSLPVSSGVKFAVVEPASRSVGFDPVDGSIWWIPLDNDWLPLQRFVVDTLLASGEGFRTTIIRSGRTSACANADGLGAPRC